MDKIDEIDELMKKIENSDDTKIEENVDNLQNYLDNLYDDPTIKDKFTKILDKILDKILYKEGEKKKEEIEKIEDIFSKIQTGDYCNLSSGPQRKCPYHHNCKRRSRSHRLLCHNHQLSRTDHWTRSILKVINKEKTKKGGRKKQKTKKKKLK